MNKSTLVRLVKKEAQSLKKRATKEELSRLNFDTLRPKFGNACLYGQMTGSCWSERAHKLIIKCADRVYDQGGATELNYSVLSNKPTSIVNENLGLGREFFSPIECFLYFGDNNTNGNNAILIDYLQGKRKTLRFKKF